MRFTPSTNWDIIASAARRVVLNTIEVKKTTDISEALSAGTWVNVTPFIIGLPSFPQAIEIEVGQFSSSSITLTAGQGMFSGGVIQWFKDNIFNASSSQYLELRAKVSLKLGTVTTSDTVYGFSGFIDKNQVTYDELQDTVSFSVYTADELGNRISAARVNTQYINPDVDGSGTDGLILPRIQGLFVTKADITSYNLKVGLHTIEYEYNSGTEQAKLDDGEFVTLPTSDGTVDLVNGDGTQKVRLYVDVSELTTVESATDYVIVITAGTTLPQQPYYGISTKNMLRKLYEQVGISTVTFDTLECNTKDGGRNISTLDVPPEDAAIGGYSYAVTTDGTDLWIAKGKYVYKRDMSAETYEQLVTLSDGDTIKKLFYNARNSHLFIFYTNGNNSYLRRYRVDADILSTAVTISTSANEVHPYSMEIVDYNYTGSSYEYAIIYGVSGNGLKRFDCSALTISQPAAFVDTEISHSNGAMFLFIKSNTTLTSLKLWYAIHSVADAWNEYKEIEITTSSTWTNNGRQLTSIPSFLTGAFDSNSGKIFTVNNIGVSPGTIEYHSTASSTSTVAVTLVTDEVCEAMYASQGKILFSVAASENGQIGTFYAYAGTTLEKEIPNLLHVRHNPMVYSSDRFYGVSVTGELWQYHTTINMCMQNFTYADKMVRDAMVSIFEAWNLTGVISSHKNAKVYRRANDSGTLQTTGNNMTLNITNTSQIVQVSKAVRAVSLVIASNSDTSVSYNGTSFGVDVLSDSYKIERASSFLPTHLLEDAAKYFYQFYSADHDKYMFRVDAALYQYEVMDGASVTFSVTKIVKTATGLITGQVLNADGSMDVEVLF